MNEEQGKGSSLLTQNLPKINNQAIVAEREKNQSINQSSPPCLEAVFHLPFLQFLWNRSLKFVFRGSFLRRQLKTLKLTTTFSFFPFSLGLSDLCYFQSLLLLIVFVFYDGD